MSGQPDQPSNEIVVVPDEQRARQAMASLGGHLFQATRAATEWAQLTAERILLIEVAEDYAVLAQGALTMTQTKQEFSGSVTLRSDGVRKSLAGLVAFQAANPGVRVNLVYLTTAQPGVEAKSSLPEGAGGIAFWRDVARGADVAPLRQLLLETQHDDAVLKLVREAGDEVLRSQVVQSVTWLTSSPGLEHATAVLESKLRSLGVERTGYAADGERALPLIIHRILRTAVAEDRRLTRDDFEQEWARATTVPVSVTMLRTLAGAGAAGHLALSPEPPPPTLSSRTAPRRVLVDDLRTELRTSDVLWLHGSSGLGKSQLSRLVEARDNTRWEFVSLGCDAAEQAVRMRNAIGRIARDDFAGIIIDDLSVPAPEDLRRWLAAASLGISALPSARMIVTSEREPLPQIRQAFEPLRLRVRDAPYLETDDVRDIVTAAGGDAETWATLIHVTCGGGHPLLVDARVAGLASKNWPAGERLQGLGVGNGPSEVEDVRREVSLRLLDELSADAHLLLLRLSGLIGVFDRKLVDAIAAIEPAIQRAGALLEYLVGPWIELTRTDRYRLSPLLHASAASLSDDERRKVQTAAIDNLIKRNPFPAELLSSLIFYTMSARHLGGFMFITRAIIGTSQREKLAPMLFPLVYMKSDENGMLVPENPGLSAMLRTAQVIAAASIDPPNMVGSIVSEGIAEANNLPGKLRGANKFTTLMAALGSESADLAPKTWMPMLVMFHNLWVAGDFPAEMTELLAATDLGGVTPDQMFFAVRSNKIDTVADLEELFDELEPIDADWRRSLLSASATLFDGPPLFVQSAWSRESGKTLDAANAALVYERLAERAEAWGETDIAIECIRSRAVMLDEYLERHEDALTVLTEAETKFGNSERLVRSKATVFATMGRHEEELALLSTLGPAYSAGDQLERLMMLRTSAISAGKLGRFAQSAGLFHQAYEAATTEHPNVLGASVRPGLLADAAAMQVRDGGLKDALSSLVLATRVADADETGDPSLAFARAAITQVTQWAAAEFEQKSFPQDPSADPGICSTLRPKFDPAELPSHKPTQEWYLLARLETIINVDVGAEQQLIEREGRDGVQLSLAVGVSAAQVQAYIARMDEDGLLALLPRYAWLSGRLMAARVKDDVASADEQIAPDGWDEPAAGAARGAVSGLLGMMLAQGRTADAAIASAKARAVSPALAFSLEAKEIDQNDDGDIFDAGLAALTLVLSENFLNAEQLLRASVKIFIWLKHVGASELSAVINGFLCKRWLDLCENHRAILSNPRIAVPAIEAAAEHEPGIVGLARLIEAGRLASSLRLAPNLAEMIRTTT
jgi:hypothetical protein